MKLLITGSSGYIGRFITADAKRRGDEILHLTRSKPDHGEWIPFDLSNPPGRLPSADALIHCAFDHIPGRYRGGEGDDPDGFFKRNLEGSIKLFEAAKEAGVTRILFLSSRAVYDGHPASTLLTEDLPLTPTSLYGQMKWEVEQALNNLDVIGTSLRATGIYGEPSPNSDHKWAKLFADFVAGKTIEPRAGTELHGDDLVAAIRLILSLPKEQVAHQAFNISDIVVDRHDLLKAYREHKRINRSLPVAISNFEKAEMDCTKLNKLGWAPRGWRGLSEFVRAV
ncbi:NAD-dependent epimerase/dehydratase family protein [Litorimonas sp.]|uniref:NAD-dependent epimerase/dehydratase family protein n=1 Tax=Litorimonas sp. TaxID=1892381 RepID=UPI003A8781F4